MANDNGTFINPPTFLKIDVMLLCRNIYFLRTKIVAVAK